MKWDSNVSNSLLICLLGRCVCYAVGRKNEAIGQMRSLLYPPIGSRVTLSRWTVHTEPAVSRRVGDSWTYT